jgi:hypothetical protein
MARTKQTTRPVMPDPRRHPPTHRCVPPESDITKLARDMHNFKSLLTQQEKNIHAMNRAFQEIPQHTHAAVHAAPLPPVPARGAMNFAQRTSISKRIGKLSSHKLNKVLLVLKKRGNLPHHHRGTVQIGINDLDEGTLWELRDLIDDA